MRVGIRWVGRLAFVSGDFGQDTTDAEAAAWRHAVAALVADGRLRGAAGIVPDGDWPARLWRQDAGQPAPL